eukprot:UN11251
MESDLDGLSGRSVVLYDYCLLNYRYCLLNYRYCRDYCCYRYLERRGPSFYDYCHYWLLDFRHRNLFYLRLVILVYFYLFYILLLFKPLQHIYFVVGCLDMN